MPNQEHNRLDANSISALRAILRLKAGLSPLVRIADVTVDFEKHSSYLTSLVESCLRLNKAFGAVVGPYGGGKTHFLLISKKIAIDHGFAVAHLSHDTGLGSLAHPQRHMLALLTSLRIPPYNQALLERLREFLDQPKNFELFCDYLHTIRSEHPEAAQIADEALWRTRLDRTIRSTSLYWFLSGASLVSKYANSSTRLQAYNLLLFWSIFCTRFLECRGLFLLFDEVEKIYDQPPLSRNAAYKTLSFYATGLPKTILLCAFTPPAWDLLISEIKEATHSILSYVTRLPQEDIETFSRIIRASQPHEASELRRRNYLELMERLKRLHSEARNYECESCNGSLVPPPISPEMTPRIFARSIVSALEVNWFHR
jgi:hypothetical protein